MTLGKHVAYNNEQRGTDPNAFIVTILGENDEIRNRSLESLCENLKQIELLNACHALDQFRRREPNLYHRVRALFFLASIYRYYLPEHVSESHIGQISFEAYQHILSRRFNEAVELLLEGQHKVGPSLMGCSALSKAYHQLAFQTLADQVRRSVRTVRGNQWMFRIGHPSDQPLRIAKELLKPDATVGFFPLLVERTSVRMDFSHSGWSDIFFLGMDYPEGAKVINAAINLGVHGRDQQPRPPVEAYFRILDRPILRLVSTDLGAEAEITEIDEVFDFAKDYLGLLKAALIASGVVPPAMEGSHRPMGELLATLTGHPNLGIELVSQVNDIPKGSRLAVSTNLLGSLIAVLMRATGQVRSLVGTLETSERRLVTARAILGEWLGGSGGGWQDSGGVWPGIKIIEGAKADASDPEFGISRGRLMPVHTHLDFERISDESRRKLQSSLILIYGGMAQNVGPILEMVTEKYLVRSAKEWSARQEAQSILQSMLSALQAGDIRRLGELTTSNFYGPLQTIIPWCTNRFTEAVIESCRARFGEEFWGFWMLGGMSGGGMGVLFDPKIQSEARSWLTMELVRIKQELQASMPFAMDPLVYDFKINDNGTCSELLSGKAAMMPDAYYSLFAPKLLKREIRELSDQSRAELTQLSERLRDGSISSGWLVDRLLPKPSEARHKEATLREVLTENGFDREQHEWIRDELLIGRLGLSQNRLPVQTRVEDAESSDVVDLRLPNDPDAFRIGEEAIRKGQIAVVTLAAGAGSRWTGGAGVVKGLNPFYQFAGRHRSFVEVHLAKSRRTGRAYGRPVCHIFTTGYLTHQPLSNALFRASNFGYRGPVHLSKGLSVGLRMIPTVRDLRFFWEETSHQILDEQQQKVREGAHAALMEWAKQSGEGADYIDNLPLQCLHPVGHWYEIPNLLRNGLLRVILSENPALQYLLLHNIDTLGASIDPTLLGYHIRGGQTLSFEVIGRKIDDRGGGLARVNGALRLLEGLAMPSEADEFKLSYYNSLTTWIHIDRLLGAFGLDREQLANPSLVELKVRQLAQRLPTYITIKDVKKRWGNGQEDIFPVAQFEKLWGDMTTLPDVGCEYFAVAYKRGQQLKEPSQLDGWLRDGSAKYIESLCDF